MKQHNTSLRKNAFIYGGWGRGMLNKVSRNTKHRLERRVDKRRRRDDKTMEDYDYEDFDAI